MLPGWVFPLGGGRRFHAAHAIRLMAAAIIPRVITLALLLCLPLIAKAQTATINWFTTDAGGGASSSALYAVSSTIGQSDAYVANGAQSQITGGFWALDAVDGVSPQSPWLAIFHAPPNVTITWPSPSAGFSLEENTVLGTTNGWQNVMQPPSDNGATKSVLVPVAGGPRFFRLRKP